MKCQILKIKQHSSSCMWSSLILNNEHTVADALKLCGRNMDRPFRWNAWIISCVAAGLLPLLFSFIWLVVPELLGLCAISRSSNLQLVHRWLRTACCYISLPSVYATVSDIVIWEDQRIKKSKEPFGGQAFATPAASSSWCPRQAVCLLLEYW